MEDFGGQSLKLLLQQNKFSLQEFVKIAIKVTEALAVIHKANIIHKDINPSNIIYNPKTKQLKVIDFGISSQLAQEFISVISPYQLEGTLAYIAPEQTGRMNRRLDYRSDFYSLGVTFYELLTQRLPFETTEPMELVHCHIAQHPLPIHELITDIPLTVSNIIGKLLAKTPEERYQSALGIKTDLENCLNQLKKQEKIELFSLGSQDIPEKLYIPQKLYGRELEVQQLLNIFEKVSQGSSEFILISGYSGIGKTALVNEIYKPITQQRGQVIKGKFDQLQRNIPYSAITQAFQDLVKQLLSEPEIQLKTYKDKILETLGNNGQIIIDIIPELEKIIGKQPPVEQLGKTESQNRFNLFFKRFLMTFCQPAHPLVIFIDDLQWADLSSLNLIEQLILDSDINYFLLIGAYRSNEVNSTHPLMFTLEKINQTQKIINKLSLVPLKNKEINQLIADTLHCSIKLAKPLGDLLNKKTQGNPFFITQLLYSLYDKKLLFLRKNLDKKEETYKNNGYWQWNIQQIESVSITDNVVDLMVNKIQKLSQKTQRVLKLAACIGNQFNLEILSIINHKSDIITAQELQSSLDEGLVIPLDNNYKIPLVFTREKLSDDILHGSPNYSADIFYKFLHDRVQQAAYSLISEEEKEHLHLQIGRILLEKYQVKQLQNKIFDIVNQLNEGANLITDQSEKNKLANLNLQAGKKSKASTAYDSALKYLEKGLELLAFDCWKTDYRLTLELHIETLEALYLNTKFTKIEELSSSIFRNTRNVFDQLKVYEIRIIYYFSIFQPQKAIDVALNFLPELGIKISLQDHEIKRRISNRQKSIKLFLKDKSIEDLAVHSLMKDPKKLAAIKIIQQIRSASNTTNFLLFTELILTLTYLCIRYGNPPQAPTIYAFYGMLMSGMMTEIDYGYQFGKLAINLLEKDNNQRFQSEIILLHYGYMWCWKNHINNQVIHERLLYGLQQGIDTGHYEYVGFIAQGYCAIKFAGGFNLEELVQDHEQYIQLVKKINQEYSHNFLKISKNTSENLRNINRWKNFLLLGDSQDEENKLLKEYLEQNNQWLLFLYYFGKMINFYVFKKFFDSLQNSQDADKYVAVTSGATLFKAQHNFYFSLASLSYYSNCDYNQQKELLHKVAKNQKNMTIWASHCPDFSR